MVTYTQPGAGAATRSVDAKIAEIRSAEDYGAAGTGAGDDGPALQSALASYTAGALTGGKVKAAGRYRVATSVALPQGAVLSGDDVSPEQPRVGQSIFDRPSLIRLVPSATVTLGRGAAIENLSIVQDLPDTSEPPLNDTAIAALLADYSGVGVTANRTGGAVRNAFVAGFDTCVLADMTAPAGGTGIDGGRINLSNLRLDGKNGVRLKNARDVSRIVDVHFWPFVTAHVNDATKANLKRPGAGLYLEGTNEFTCIERFFAFGAARGMVFDGANDVFATDCQIDHPDAVGNVAVDILNGAYAIHLVNLHTEAQQVGVRINSVGPAGAQGAAREVVADIRGGRIVATDICVDIQNGDTLIDGVVFRAAAVKIRVGAIADNVTIVNPVFDDAGVAIRIDAGFTGRCKIDLGLPCLGTPVFDIPDALITAGRVVIHDPYNYTGKAAVSAQSERNTGKLNVGTAALIAPMFGVIQASVAAGSPHYAFWKDDGADNAKLADIVFDGQNFYARRLSNDGLTVQSAVRIADTGVPTSPS